MGYYSYLTGEELGQSVVVLNQEPLEVCEGMWVTTLTAEVTLAFSKWEPGILNSLQCAGQTHRIIQPQILALLRDTDQG